MEDLMHSVRLKLTRAALQRDLLLSTTAEWVVKQQPSFRCENHPFKHGFQVILNPFTEPPPFDDLAVLFGEFTHNLRSALDNLAFSLARLQRDPPESPGSIGFPIFDDNNSFQKNKKRYLRQLPDAAADLIEQLQPYNRDAPGGEKLSPHDPLFLLQKFNNNDKHQIPSIVLLAPREMANNFTVEFENEEEASLNLPPDTTIWGGPLSSGVVLLDYRTKHPIRKAKGNLNMRCTVSIICAQDRKEFVETVTNLHAYTCLVVEQFSPFFK